MAKGDDLPHNRTVGCESGLIGLAYPVLNRRCGRVDECGGLENRCPRKRTVGSNPTTSDLKRDLVSLREITRRVKNR